MNNKRQGELYGTDINDDDNDNDKTEVNWNDNLLRV